MMTWLILLILAALVQVTQSSQYRNQPGYQQHAAQNYHNSYNQHYHQAHQHAQQHAHQQQRQQPYPHQNYPSPNSIKAYQTAYPAVPHASVLNQPTHQICDIPPDLWCDSPQSAQQCGVQRQCDSLRHRRQPIKITLIYEALCPYCQKFISNQLGSVFNQYQGQLILELIPWGNARILRDGSFSCNHGQKECDANRLQSCVIDILKEIVAGGAYALQDSNGTWFRVIASQPPQSGQVMCQFVDVGVCEKFPVAAIRLLPPTVHPVMSSE
uniref:Tudor domain-containing protein n=2 Tax=Caenorhabditis japonica TaxID=281687 RepID=A0A8R1I2P7_CAEJA